MGPEAAINAVYANKIAEKPPEERQAYVEQLRDEYRKDVDIYKLNSEMIVDGMVTPTNLRQELINRFEVYSTKKIDMPKKKQGVLPV